MADNQQYGPLAPKQNSASDIRSVIANATKKSGAGMTIATKDELNQKKVSNTNGLSNKNIVNTTNTKVNPNIAKVNNTKPTSVITPKTTKAAQPTQQQGTKMSSLIQGQVSGDLFKNPAVQPINNVKVEQINGKNQNLSDSYVNYHLDKNEIKNMLVETPEEKKKRQSEGVEKLYIDAYRKKKDGGVLTVEDVLGNANYQRELNGIEQGVLQEMVNDANTLANAGKFNMDNAMALFDKYQDLGIQIDYNKLSPESKAQFVGDMLNNKQSTLGKIISWATPMGQISNIKELITGKSMTDDILDTITKLEESSHKNLTDKDTDKIASKQIKKLDEAYKDFYDMGKKAPSLIDYATNIKNVGDLYYKHKYGVDEDQKIWKDKDKEKEYNEELNKIRSAIKEQHGDTAANVARNTLIGSAKALLTVANMASDLPSFGKMIWDLGKGGVEDTVGAIASVGKTAYDTAKYAKDTGDFEVQWDAKDIRQRVAEAGGYDNYNDFVAKVEQEMGGSPLGQFLAWSLKDADTSMNTANALGNYFIEKYGTLDDGLTAFKNDPVEATSDWIPWGQFNVKLLEKLGLISSAKANKIIEASRWMDAYDKPFELVNKFQFGPLLKMEGKLLGGVSKLGLGSINLPFKLVSRAVDAVFSKLTGIDKESRNFIRENPDEVLSYVNGEKTSDGILRDIKDKFDEITDEKRQIGEEYEAIKNNDVPVKSKEILDNIMNTLSEFGVKISDKGVEYTKILPQFVEKNVKELLRFVDDYKKKGETPSASETHYFRQLVDTLAKWESNTPAKGIEAQFINSVKDIRRTIDNALKDQVPGMKEADAAYSAALDTIKELRRDWFDKDGTLKDSAYSRIRNLTNKGSNQPKLERLESVIPGITKQLKSLAVSEVIERGMKQATGQYLNQIASGAGLGAIASLLTGGVSLPTLIIGALGMMYATPENFAHLLRFEGKVTKPIRDIANKISNRTKLTAKETSNLVDFMLDNQERLGKTAQYMYEKGLLEEPMKASDIKAPKSKDPTLKELTEYKESLKKDLKEGKISQKYYDDEIHGKNGEPGIDYAIAQKKARTKIGDKEKVLSAEDKERVTNFIKKRANDVGFVTKMFEHLPYDEGFTVLRDKLIAFSKNPGNTTSQHELFHAFFSVVDNKTKTYLIQEARKILKDNGMAIKDAEEWLAESFGIYAKRKMIDLGMIKNAPKGVVDKFVSTLRNFFQRVYEYMQKFNGDRATINKIFDEVLGEKQMKDGIMDLSDLLGDKKLDKKLLREIELGDNGLRNKSVYHGSPADFDKFDSSHMGEGEGAQAHGWGHYVAVDKKTAEKYANINATTKVHTELTYKGKSNGINSNKIENSALRKLDGEYWLNYYDDVEGFKRDLPEIKDNLIKNAEKRIKLLQQDYYDESQLINSIKKSGGEVTKDRIDRLEFLKTTVNKLNDEIKDLKEIKAEDFGGKQAGGRQLYNLDIPDPKKADTPTGSNYFEEGDTISPKAGKKIADKLREKGHAPQDDIFGHSEEYLNRLLGSIEKGEDGRAVYEDIAVYLGGQKEASKFLESLGYDGIHYYGGVDGEAYVIFNDDALQIKDHIRYKKSGLEQKEQTKSSEFKKWFGDWEKGGKNVSKVVNADGTPKVVYHGTANKFNEFKQLPGYRGGAGLGVLGDGFYFTDSKKTAKSYSKEKTNNPLKLIFGGNIMETYLDIKKPYELKYTRDADIPSKKDLKAKGYDGIIADMPSGEKYYVAFEPNQIKSATDNVGTFDKNSNDIRYKKKIGDKDVEINKDITSPDQMAKVNSKGLSVIHDFISEKQAEKALDVSKDILDENGNAYLWTHTNKYNDKMFANFDNTRDSKYRSFKDNQIGWLTNSEDMSKSYADQKSKLAPTKKFNSVQEVNDYFKKNPIVQKWQGWNDAENETSFKYRMEKSKDLKGNDYWKLESQKSEKVTYDNIETMWNAFKDSWMNGDLGEMPKNPEEALRILKDKRFGDATELKVLKNGKIEKVDTYDWTYVEGYDTDQQAIAEGYAKGTNYKAYHYQGIAQNMKNPLVVDIRNPDGTQTYWNKLGNGYEFLEKNNKEGLDKAIKVIDELKKQAEPVEKSINEVKEEIGNKVTGKALLGIEGLAKRFIEDALMGKEPFGVKEEWMEKGKEFINNNPEFKELYDRAKEIYNNNKDLIELKKGFKYESNYEIKDYLKAKGVDGGVAGILRGIGSDSIADINIKDYLKDYNLETNDYVFYALSKGGYDGVLFKNISDYGGKSNLKKGGDVLAIFKSSQFKSWDNSTPTDSKYISYKKKVSLDKKPEGLQKKDSNGLLAKGRERMGDNGMRYKKSEYEQAVESGDKEKALGMIRKAAAEKGYDSSSDYQGSKAFNGSAPSSEGYTKAERINPDTEMYSQTLGDYASDGVDIGDLDWQLTDRGNYIRGDEYIRESIDNLNKAVREYKAGNKNAKIKMYRAIDADIKENGFRNGDWITPSKKYAKMHIGLQDWKKGRIIEEEVPIENIWWDNNDINEWGYDDGKEYGYKNTPNNKKELGITYDDKGKLIPLEKRFDEKNPDVRFKKKSESEELSNYMKQHYKQTGEAYDKNGYVKPEYRYNPRESLPNPRGGWTKKSIEKYLHNFSGQQRGTYRALDAIREFDNAQDFKDHTFYHGTAMSFAGKPSMSLTEKQYDKMADRFGGGYGQRYWAISLTTDKKIASNFGGGSSSVSIYPVILRKDAKVIEMPNIHDSIELEDHIEKLWNDGVDAVWVGDKNSGEKELAVINPNAIVDLNSPDIYRQYHLGMKDNPLNIKSDKDFDKIYERAPELQEERRRLEREEKGLKNKFFKDNYGKSSSELMDEDFKKYREAKSEYENTEEYKGLRDKLRDTKWNAEREIRYKKVLTAKDQTQTPEFKKWFEGSKVVDKSGKPLVMYHGTNSDFNTFDKGLIKSQNWGKGFYFTSNKEDAKQYGKNTKAVYLDVKNPLDLTSGENEAEYNKWYGKKNSPYDGYVVNFSNGDKMVVVKSPNQIKSATDNIGTFDKNNPDIRYKKGLEKKSDGLEKKRTSTASSFQGRVDAIANELGVKGGNTVQKMKRINKIIKEDKYKGTDIKKRFYQLKWEYKKQYIINNDKKIKDKGFKRTTLRVWQNGKKADWHFTKKQYEELKELGYIE